MDGGGQVIEQATHLYDLARLLVGEAEVVGAASLHETPATPPGADVADASAAVLRFATGAVGTFANTRRQSSPVIDIAFSCDGQLTTIRKAGPDPGAWEVELRDGQDVIVLPPGRDPYEIQAETFLDAVVAGDPSAVASTYADACSPTASRAPWSPRRAPPADGLQVAGVVRTASEWRRPARRS